MRNEVDRYLFGATAGICAAGFTVLGVNAVFAELQPPAIIAPFDPKDMEMDADLRQAAFDAHCREIKSESVARGIAAGMFASGFFLSAVAMVRRASQKSPVDETNEPENNF